MAEFRREGVSIQTSQVGTTIVVKPTGEIDLTGSPDLRVEIRKAQATRPAKLVVDLSAVPYMDSSGLATLVDALNQARKGGTKLVLCCLGDRVKSIFEIARLDQVFNITGSAEEAMTK